MNWFEKLTGFRETTYEKTRSRLEVEGNKLHSLVNGASYGIGELELVSLQALRDNVKFAGASPGRIKTAVVTGDVRRMHQFPENAGALFQVASQFNLLEMTSYDVTPEHGVTRYQDDHTQGPACAIAAGAATIYRNYFAPIEGSWGQTATRQLDGLADMGVALSDALGVPVSQLWKMHNGYALGTKAGLNAIARHLETLTLDQLDALRGKLRIGCIAMWKSLKRSGRTRCWCLKLFARRCRLLTVVCRPSIGSRLPCRSLRLLTRPRC